MKGKKLLAAGIIFCIVTVGICACKQEKEDTTKKLYVGVTCYNQNDEFIGELIDCFKEEVDQLQSDELKTTVTVRDAAGSQRTQNDQVKELIGAGCNVLCVNLVERADPSEIIDTAKKNNVPIIFFNREPVAEDLMQWEELYYVGADAKQSGVMQGELAVELIKKNNKIDRNKDGKIQYVVLEGEPGHQDSIIRTENAVNTLKDHGVKMEKLSYGIANWSRAQAQNRMTQIIGQYQNQIELVLANNDDMALGAIDAYEKANFTESTKPVFLGIDGIQNGLKAVVDSKMAGTVYNDKEGQAEALAKLAGKLALGEKPKEKYIYLSYSKVTRENVQEYLEK